MLSYVLNWLKGDTEHQLPAVLLSRQAIIVRNGAQVCYADSCVLVGTV